MPGATLVPLNSSLALPRYAQAGVGEVYVGFHDEEWTAAFGPHADLNRMSGFGAEANPFSFDEMLGLLREARELGMGAFVCFNAASYNSEQVAYIAEKYLPRIAQAQAAGVIVSGLALVGAIADAGLRAVMSTVAGVFNARLAAYYRDAGAARVILPRDLSIDEIAGVVRSVPDLEYEVFLMRNGCMFSDSHCLGRHCAGKPSLCLSLREAEQVMRPVARPFEQGGVVGDAARGGGYTPDGRADAPYYGRADGVAASGEANRAFLDRAWESEGLLNRYYHRRTCGLCALWRLEQLGVSAYKVVGRGDDLDDLCADAGLVARNVALAAACATEAEYHERMERPRHPETLCGYRGLSCYYPEVARFSTTA